MDWIFLQRVKSILKILYIVSKYQIFCDIQGIKLPALLKICANIFSVVLYPANLYIKTTKSFGERLCLALQDLGPIYTKFGQTIATRPDIIGNEISACLRTLQDYSKPTDTKYIIAIIEKSFAMKIDELFSTFSFEPIASASIAQVHRATLKTGEMVAVKVLKPNIHLQYKRDIIFLGYISALLLRFVHKAKYLRLQELIGVFEQTMECELNLKFEGAFALQIKDNCKKDFDLYIPKIYWQMTAKSVLTTEWIDGFSVYDKASFVANNIDAKVIAQKIALIFFNQAYRDGIFHADLHPGNILITKNGSIALVDFGIVGKLSEKDRLAIAESIFAFTKRDYMSVAKIHLKAGYIPNTTNLILFSESCRVAVDDIIGIASNKAPISALLMKLFEVMQEFEISVQPQLILLQKTLVVVEGVGQILDKEINMWDLITPWIKKWAAKNITPEAKVLRLLKSILNLL